MVTLSDDALVESSNPLVVLSSSNKVKIVGIDFTSGLLKAEGLSGQGVFLLQPDGNSFDMMQNLIKRKV